MELPTSILITLAASISIPPVLVLTLTASVPVPVELRARDASTAPICSIVKSSPLALDVCDIVPAISVLNIQASGYIGNISVQVFNSIGEIMFVKYIDSSSKDLNIKLDVSHYSRCIYQVQIVSDK